MDERYPILTPEQEARIPFYQEKWRAVALSTEAIDRDKAAAAVTNIYTLMGKTAPTIEFYPSPYAALVAISNREESEPTQETEANENETSSETVWQKIWSIVAVIPSCLRFISNIIGQNLQYKKDPLYWSQAKLNRSALNWMKQKVDDVLPKNLSKEEIPDLIALIFDRFFQQESSTSRSQDDERETRQSIRMGLADAYQKIFWFPGKEFLATLCLQHWVKGMYSGQLAFKIQGKGKIEADIEKRVNQQIAAQQMHYQNVITSFRPQFGAMQAVFYDFISTELDCPIDDRLWQAYQDLVSECGWIFSVDGVCYICDRPRILRFDDENDIAIEFADGFSI